LYIFLSKLKAILWCFAAPILLNFQGENYLYGNNVTSDLTSLIDTGGNKAFIDTDKQLKKGTLMYYYFYASAIPRSSYTRFQIYRPTSDTLKFTLVWQVRVFINSSATGLVYKVGTVAEY